MFDSQTRYLTCGIQSEMPPEMQMCLWNSIDRQLSMNLPLDYLQVFKFEKLDDEVLAIRHEQEQPARLTVFYTEYREEYADLLCKKVFVIDDGDHSTMLFADEY